MIVSFYAQIDEIEPPVLIVTLLGSLQKKWFFETEQMKSLYANWQNETPFDVLIEF